MPQKVAATYLESFYIKQGALYIFCLTKHNRSLRYDGKKVRRQHKLLAGSSACRK